MRTRECGRVEEGPPDYSSGDKDITEEMSPGKLHTWLTSNTLQSPSWRKGWGWGGCAEQQRPLCGSGLLERALGRRCGVTASREAVLSVPPVGAGSCSQGPNAPPRALELVPLVSLLLPSGPWKNPAHLHLPRSPWCPHFSTGPAKPSASKSPTSSFLLGWASRRALAAGASSGLWKTCFLLPGNER